MDQRFESEKMKKSDLDHNALIFKKTQKICDDKFFIKNNIFIKRI
jgi:hypothetical protein